jgi:hypothetical protein
MGALAPLVLILAFGTPAQPYQAGLEQARVPLPAERVELRRESCPLAPTRSCTAPDQPVIWIAPHTSWRRHLYHELGHRFDYRMPTRVRTQFMRLMGFDGEWRNPPNSPHEQFAEAYAICARGRWPSEVMYAYDPSPRQHRAVCKLIRNA